MMIADICMWNLVGTKHQAGLLSSVVVNDAAQLADVVKTGLSTPGPQASVLIIRLMGDGAADTIKNWLPLLSAYRLDFSDCGAVRIVRLRPPGREPRPPGGACILAARRIHLTEIERVKSWIFAGLAAAAHKEELNRQQQKLAELSTKIEEFEKTESSKSTGWRALFRGDLDFSRPMRELIREATRLRAQAEATRAQYAVAESMLAAAVRWEEKGPPPPPAVQSVFVSLLEELPTREAIEVADWSERLAHEAEQLANDLNGALQVHSQMATGVVSIEVAAVAVLIATVPLDQVVYPRLQAASEWASWQMPWPALGPLVVVAVLLLAGAAIVWFLYRLARYLAWREAHRQVWGKEPGPSLPDKIALLLEKLKAWLAWQPTETPHQGDKAQPPVTPSPRHGD